MRLQATLHKKILFNFVLLLLGHYRTVKNTMPFCPKGSRQLFIRKNYVQCCLNNLAITLRRSKPYAMLSKWLQTKLLKKKFCLMLPGTTLLSKRCALKSETILVDWKPFKNDENCSLFYLKGSFRSQDI